MKSRIKKIIGIVMIISIIIGNTLSVLADVHQGVEDFVTRCYRIALGRDPDQAGLNDWVNQLTSGQACGVSVAQGFVYSPEFQNSGLDDRTYVERMYNMLLGRNSDANGMDYWLQKLAQGESRESIFAGFANSIEFFNLCSSYGIYAGYYISGSSMSRNANINAFVDRLYSICLNRHADMSGQGYWVSNLAIGTMSGSEVAYGFIFSSEYIDKQTNNREYVTMLYNTFLGRTPDEGGINNWLNILSSNNSREHVFNGFANSQEFMGICESYGIVRGEAQYADNLFTPDRNGSTDANGSNNVYVPNIPDISIPDSNGTNINRPAINPLDYTYEIYPLFENVNSYFYIKTNNPDPHSFRLYDESSVYYSNSDSPTKYIVPVFCILPDVQYEDEATFRVNGGYIATSSYTENYDETYMPIGGSYVDGGELILQIATSYNIVHVEGYDYQQDSSYHSYDLYNPEFVDSGVRIQCETLVDDYDYIINNYANEDVSFWDNMDYVFETLWRDISVYPRFLFYDQGEGQYHVGFVASRYPELGLNANAIIYPFYNYYDLLSYVYPYCLSSLGFPEMMARIAERLEPSCTYTQGQNHYDVDITYNGETRTYGAAGMSYGRELYLSQVRKIFTFDGAPGDLSMHNTLEAYHEAFVSYSDVCADNYNSTSGQLTEEAMGNAIGDRGWIRVALEWSSNDVGYAFFSKRFHISIFENIWVDGRYINQHNIYENITFAQSLEKNPNLYFSSYYVASTNESIDDALFEYVPSENIWVCNQVLWAQSLNSNIPYSQMPDEAVITYEEALTMNLDANRSTPPAHGYIYDCSAEPGTPF